MSVEKYFQNKFDFTFLCKINDIEEGLLRPNWCKENIPILIYSATFSRAKNHLTVSAARKKGSELVYEFKDIEGKPAWFLFYQFATFKDILDSIDLTPWFKVINKREEFFQYKESFKGGIKGDNIVFRFTPGERAIFRGEPAPEPERETKLALEVIRDCPTALLDKEYAYKLIDLLTEVRYSLDEEKAKKASKLLTDHLIPKRRSLPKPSNIKAVREVMVELARQLSRDCKEMMKYDYDFVEDIQVEKCPRCKYEKPEGEFPDTSIHCPQHGNKLIKRNEKITQEMYEKIKKQAHDKGEFRISRLSLEDIRSLIITPPKYVNRLLTQHFNKVCLKTLTG